MIHKPTFGIVIHGISIEFNLDDEEIIKELVCDNRSSGNVNTITPLHHKNLPQKAPTYNRLFEWSSHRKSMHRKWMLHISTFSTMPHNISFPSFRSHSALIATNMVTVLETANEILCTEMHKMEHRGTTVQRVHRESTHEAWRSKRPARIVEIQRLEKLRGRCPPIFIV